MRTFLIAATLVVLASPATAATRNFGITSFEKIRIDGPYKVRLTTGVAPFAKASGSQAAVDRIAMDVRGNTLVVHTSLSWSGSASGNGGPVEILLGTHDLNTVWLNGSGTIAVDKVKGLLFGLSVQGSGAASIANAAVDQLNVTIAGTGSASVAGKAGKMVATVRGVSSLDASHLATKDATIGAEGTATVDANVSNSVKVDGNGPLTVRLTGGPACTLRVGGSATVSGCKSTQ
ncbi:MAG: GIN domain-containing protein [Sphingomicrobium sp.]